MPFRALRDFRGRPGRREPVQLRFLEQLLKVASRQPHDRAAFEHRHRRVAALVRDEGFFSEPAAHTDLGNLDRPASPRQQTRIPRSRRRRFSRDLGPSFHDHVIEVALIAFANEHLAFLCLDRFHARTDLGHGRFRDIAKDRHALQLRTPIVRMVVLALFEGRDLSQ